MRERVRVFHGCPNRGFTLGTPYKIFLETEVKIIKGQKLDDRVLIENAPLAVKKKYESFQKDIPATIDVIFCLFKNKNISKENLLKMRVELPHHFQDRIWKNADILRKGVSELHRGRNMDQTLRKILMEIGGLRTLSEHLLISYKELKNKKQEILV